jgi:small-conductance mechanosensitive channel
MNVSDLLNPQANFPHGYVYPIMILLGAIIVGFVLHAIISFIFKHRKFRKKITLQQIELQFDHLKGPLRSLIPAICVSIALPFLKIEPRVLDTINHIVDLWLIASIAWIAIGIVHIGRDAILGHFQIDTKDNLRARQVYTQIRMIERILIVIILVIGISVMLMSFSKVRQVGVSLLASAGIIGIILGFAAQRTLGNLLAGIQIAIAQPIRLEDVVIVENEWGWIEEITLTYVVVRIWDLRRLIVPISYFIENPIQNWTRQSADLLGTVYLYADYTVPVKAVREELTRILENSSDWDKKVNVLQVTNITEHTVELRALMSAIDSPTTWNLRCEVREKLLSFLQEHFPECLPKVRLETGKDGETADGEMPGGSEKDS